MRHDLLLWAIGAVTVHIGKEPSDLVKGMKKEVATKGEDILGAVCPRVRLKASRAIIVCLTFR